jgi:hypothetical protein
MLDRRTLAAAAIAAAAVSCDAVLGIEQYGGSTGDGGLDDAAAADESSSESWVRPRIGIEQRIRLE